MRTNSGKSEYFGRYENGVVRLIKSGSLERLNGEYIYLSNIVDCGPGKKISNDRIIYVDKH